MKLSRRWGARHFTVNWWLMNHCSWSCSYCHEIIRAGNIDLPYLKDCQRFIDSAELQASRLGLSPYVEFTGGEVTEWVDFDELLIYAKSRGWLTHFRSNANVEYHRWQRLVSSVDKLNLEYHVEHTQTSRFLIALQQAQSQGVETQVTVNMIRDRWQETQEVYDEIQKKWPQVRLHRRMLFEDPVFNTQPQKYDQAQVNALKNQNGDIKVEFHDRTEYTDYQTLVLEDKNTFKGWNCWAGLEQCVVDAWGRVYRGHCRLGGFMGNIKDQEIRWPELPIVCAADRCKNSFDILSTKESRTGS